MPGLQRKRCVPDDSQPFTIGTRALACSERVITNALVQCLGCSVNARKRCVPGARLSPHDRNSAIRDGVEQSP